MKKNYHFCRPDQTETPSKKFWKQYFSQQFTKVAPNTCHGRIVFYKRYHIDCNLHILCYIWWTMLVNQKTAVVLFWFDSRNKALILWKITFTAFAGHAVLKPGQTWMKRGRWKESWKVLGLFLMKWNIHNGAKIVLKYVERQFFYSFHIEISFEMKKRAVIWNLEFGIQFEITSLISTWCVNVGYMYDLFFENWNLF